MTEKTLNLPNEKSPALRVMAQPTDANIHGDVFGGWIMAQVDIAGSIPATQRANGRVATVAVNSFQTTGVCRRFAEFLCRYRQDRQYFDHGIG